MFLHKSKYIVHRHTYKSRAFIARCTGVNYRESSLWQKILENYYIQFFKSKHHQRKWQSISVKAPLIYICTLESGIDVGQGIAVGSGKFVKKNKCRALNKHRAWTKCANLCYKNPIKLENIYRLWEKFQNLLNVGPLIRL